MSKPNLWRLIESYPEYSFHCISCGNQSLGLPGYMEINDGKKSTYKKLWNYCPYCGIEWSGMKLGYLNNERGLKKRRWLNSSMNPNYRINPVNPLRWVIEERYPNLINKEWKYYTTIRGNAIEIKKYLNQFRGENKEDGDDSNSDGNNNPFYREFRAKLETK